jgi:hypothetical protein
MSAVAPLLSPAAKAVLAAISQLSPTEKAEVVEFLQSGLAEEEFPEWQMEIVRERLQRLDEGKSIAIPLDEALAPLNRKWTRKS